MPKLSRKELKQYCEEQTQQFQRLIEKQVKVSFGKHSFVTELKAVKLARQADMDNVPDMRADEFGKQYTPSCLQVECEGGDLFFVIEDIQNIGITFDGTVLYMNHKETPYTVMFSEWLDI